MMQRISLDLIGKNLAKKKNLIKKIILIERFVGFYSPNLFKILMVLLYSVNEAAHQNYFFFLVI
jgi:hypothetical protein